jgi:HTH-type transcriptional regulator/antitoxin HipB
MNYPVDTPSQAKAVLRALRRSRGLSQTQVGESMGLSQKRIARIEAAPGRASFDQITKLVSLLGGQMVIEVVDSDQPTTKTTKTGGGKW